MRNYKPYVLVTPARNEEDFIELTIRSVLAQTVRPLRWVIVSDRSIDRTDQIVNHFAEEHPFIHFIRNHEPSERTTAAKVHAISLGIKGLAGADYAYFGNLDADVSFGETYFEELLTYCEDDSRLGVAGGRIFQADGRGRAYEVKASTESVAGAVQFFRKECFDQIGGYESIPGGMEDGIAEITARYLGWKTRSFAGLPVLHHRQLGTVGRSVYAARFNSGLTEYVVGFGFSYHAIRALSRILEKPYLIGTLLILSGYMCGLLSGHSKAVPAHIEEFIRGEQKARLLTYIAGIRKAVFEARRLRDPQHPLRNAG